MQSIGWIRITGILLLGLVWIGVSADRISNSTNGHIPAPQKGFLAPDFTLETIYGDGVTLSDLRGRVVIINLWASWCGPCRLEMAALREVHEEYKDQDLVILAVNSTSQDSLQAVESFIIEYQLPFSILMDYDGIVSRQYKLSALPTTFFIRRDGVINRVVIGGPMTKATLRAEIKNLLIEEMP